MIAEQILALILLALCGGFGLGWTAKREAERTRRRKRRERTRQVVREVLNAPWPT